MLAKIFKSLQKNDRGILWNPSFLQAFVNAGFIEEYSEPDAEENKEGGDKKEEENTEDGNEKENNQEPADFEDEEEKSNDNESEALPESVNDIFFKTYLKTIICEDGDNISPPFNMNTAIGRIGKLGVAFEFNKIQYCEGVKKGKRKELINANRVEEMNGKVFLKFIPDGKGGKPIIVNVSDTLSWTQYRTANMDPPTPIMDEVKKIWANPNQGYGLVGLGLKKLGGAAWSFLTGSSGSKTVSEEDFDCGFKDEFSINNSKGVASAPENGEKGGDESDLTNAIESRLNSKSGKYIDWDIQNKGGEISCTALYNGDELLEITFSLK